MPVYEFRCLECRKKFPLTLSVTQLTGKRYKCPRCGSRKLEKQISMISVVTSRKS